MAFTAADIRQRIKNFPRRARESARNFNCVECIGTCRNSNRMIVFVVFVAIFVDYMLTTTVTPIMPAYIFQQEHPKDYERLRGNDNSTGYKSSCKNIDVSNITFVTDTDAIAEMNCTIEEIPAYVMKQKAEEKLRQQSLRIGLLFASKSLVQLIVNPFIGVWTNSIGYSIPMFAGFVIIFVSTIVFAFGTNYWVLLTSRAVQGAGSSCASVAGMGLIADRYTDDKERGDAMAVALSGIALGVMVGPPFGGVMYQYLGKASPFLVLAFLTLVDGALQLYVMKPSKQPDQQEGTSLLQLLKDPYILLTAGAIAFANMSIGMLEPTLPAFMLQRMQATTAETGLIFLPTSISYLLGTLIFGHIALKIGRWRAAMIGMIFIGLALFVIPFSTMIPHLIAPNACLGFSIGMVDSAMMPTMGYLVDIRHVSVYGSVYAIADIAFCFGFLAGPAVSAVVVHSIGFGWTILIVSISNLVYAPLLYFLRKPSGKAEKTPLVSTENSPNKYSMSDQSSDQTTGEDRVDNGIVNDNVITETSLQVDEYNHDGEIRTTTAYLTTKAISRSNGSISSCTDSTDIR